MPVITTQKCHFQAPIQSETVYSCSYSKGGNEDLLDFLQKRFITLTKLLLFLLRAFTSKPETFETYFYHFIFISSAKEQELVFQDLK